MKYGVKSASFVQADFVSDLPSLPNETFDLVTVGFELSMDVVRSKTSLFRPGTFLVVPVSESKERC